LIPLLVPLYRAKAHVRSNEDDSEDLYYKVEQASGIIMDYLKMTEIPVDWIKTTSPVVYAIPHNVQAATLLVVSELYENREGSVSNPLSQAVMDLLHRLRDPAMS
jgi:hypothetical protein